jgi:acetyltransferase-like isoleucine patch superfamily enzyme
LNKFTKLKSGIKKVKFGKNCKLIEPVNLYECKIGNSVFIGPFVEIQKNVKVGDNTRVQSHTFICEKVSIGKNCFISHGSMFVNELAEKGMVNRDPKKFKKTTLGDNVTIGSNSTILPVNIAKNIVVGAGSVVTKDLSIKGIYVGNPAKLLRRL